MNGLTDLVDWLASVFPSRVTPQSVDQSTAGRQPTYRPEPNAVNAAVLPEPIRAFTDRDSDPSEIDLVVEVSDSTLDQDLNERALKCARAGIVE